ncbi:MAG: DUF4845 domain-containing protein [Burkholderiales bacterium]
MMMTMTNQHQQRGVSLGGLIVVLFLLIMGLLLGFKLFPPYLEHEKIKKAFKAVAANPEVRGGSRALVEGAYVRYQLIDSITSVGPTDLEISNEGGQLVVSATYSVKVPLFHNISVLLDFAPSSQSK